jgi:hypothetical protein
MSANKISDDLDAYRQVYLQLVYSKTLTTPEDQSVGVLAELLDAMDNKDKRLIISETINYEIEKIEVLLDESSTSKINRFNAITSIKLKAKVKYILVMAFAYVFILTFTMLVYHTNKALSDRTLDVAGVTNTFYNLVDTISVPNINDNDIITQ